MSRAGIVARHVARNGPRVWPAFAAAVLHLPRWVRASARPGDDARMIRAKGGLTLAGAFFGELVQRFGRDEALRVVRPLLDEVAVDAQRQAYGRAGTWDAFHLAHNAEMASGFVGVNDHDEPEVSPGSVRFHIVRCRLHEALSDMGAPELTEAFCRSDEVVFPSLVPDMRFDRGDERPNTIARGGARCGFVFRRSDHPATNPPSARKLAPLQ